MSLAHTAMAGTENQPFQIRYYDYSYYGTTPQAIRSSPAASHHSAGVTGPSSESSFEFITNSPNMAPSLQLTLSNNGSDKSDGGSWVIFDPETRSSTGSAGHSITRPRQTTSLEQLNQTGVWDQLMLVTDGYYVQQQPTYSGHSPVPIAGHVNQHHPVSLMQDSTLDTSAMSNAICTPPSPLGTWHDLGSGASIGAPSDKEIFGYPADIDALQFSGTETASGTSRNGSIDAQQTSIRALHTIKKDDSRRWKYWLLNSTSASDGKQPLLGIPPPMDLDQFKRTPKLPSKSVRRTPSTAAGCSTPNTSDFRSEGFIGMADSTRVHPRTTFCASSTSSFPPRDYNGALVAGPERRLKRPIEDTPCAIESSTSTANPAANVFFGEHQNINSSALSPVRVAKKAKSRNLPLGMSTSSENYSLYNSQFFQPHVVPSYRTTADLMDDESTHAPAEAEHFFSPATGRAEFIVYPPHTLEQDFPEQDALNRIHEEREPPDASDFPFNSHIGFLNPGIIHNFPISPEIPYSTMEDRDGADFDLDDTLSINDISSNPVSPSEHGQVATPSESAGPLYGPQRPPQSHLTAQQVFDPYQCQTNSLQLQGASGWQSPYAQMAMNWPSAPCTYPQQLHQPGNDTQGSGDEYEAEDEEPRGGGTSPTSKLPGGTQRKRKRGAFEDERRVIVGKVREAGACMRCHFLRESCDLGNPCGNCRKVDGKQKIWGNLPCERLNITEAVLFRKGNSKFKQESAVLLRVHDQWIPNAETKRLVLGRPPPIAAKYWGKGLAYPGLRIQCREFNPTPKDLLHETWNEDGKEVIYKLPPFAATDIEDLSDAIKGYVRDTFDLFKHDMISEEHDPLVRLVFGEAIRYSDQHQCANGGKQGIQETCMLKDALKIWILTRLAYEGYGILEGGDSFGVDMINNPKSPYHETVPIPPILDHQLDTVGIRYMITLKDNVLRALKKKIAKRRQSQWYEVFLTIFVLLHNLEYVARRQYLYMKRHEYTWAANGETNIAFFTTTWMAEWEAAANSLIKHFQVALKGAVPFSFNWERSDHGEDDAEGDGAKSKKKGNRKGKKKETVDPVEEARKKAGMDDQAVEFMKAVTSIIQRRKAEFQTLQKESDRRQYENDMVWVSQLFLDVE